MTLVLWRHDGSSFMGKLLVTSVGMMTIGVNWNTDDYYLLFDVSDRRSVVSMCQLGAGTVGVTNASRRGNGDVILLDQLNQK